MPLLSHPRPLRAGFIDPCLPTTARVPPSGAGWLHEIKHDGYRLIARLEGRWERGCSRGGVTTGPSGFAATVIFLSRMNQQKA